MATLMLFSVILTCLLSTTACVTCLLSCVKFWLASTMLTCRAFNSLLKSLPGINESHLAVVVVEVLGNGLVMHVLNRRLRCSSARHT